MRNVALAQDGGAIVGAPVRGEPAAAAQSQLEAAGKPTLAAPYLNLQEALAEAHRERAEVLVGLARRFVAWLREGVKRATQSDIERYLAHSTDLADLEHRLQALNRGERPLAY